jgi:6-methylsalicylate decarboxylase
MDVSVRRGAFLAGISAVGAELAWGSVPASAQTSGRVDVHIHHGSPGWVSGIPKADLTPAVSSLKDWPVTRMLEEMDRAGTQTGLLSLTAPGIWFGDAMQARKLARDSNEWFARLVADHPKRFGFFAALPLPDVEGSLQEIAYGLDTLKADGIELFTSGGGKYLGDPLFNPVFEELNRRNAVVFVHPPTPQCCTNLVPGIGDTVIEAQTDTTRAIAGMIFSGASQRYPNIRMIFCHAGGTMPSVNERLALLAKTPRYQPVLPGGFLAEASKFYYDTATTANVATMSAIRKLVPPSHMVFGTDFPFRGITDQAQSLNASGVFTAVELDAINRGNAAALLPRIAR